MMPQSHLDQINKVFFDKLVCFDYPEQGQGNDVARILVFKSFNLNKQGEIYLTCLEKRRDGEKQEQIKNFTEKKLKNFALANWLDRVKIFVDDRWISMKKYLQLNS